MECRNALTKDQWFLILLCTLDITLVGSTDNKTEVPFENGVLMLQPPSALFHIEVLNWITTNPSKVQIEGGVGAHTT